jgi:hypothetical protein
MGPTFTWTGAAVPGGHIRVTGTRWQRFLGGPERGSDKQPGFGVAPRACLLPIYVTFDEYRYRQGRPGGVGVGNTEGARQWSIVLSELADVQVAVVWERPAWRVRWVDGPTREALMDRATALSKYRVGAPLIAERLRFVRSDSAEATALGWLAIGSPTARNMISDGVAAVEALCEETGYPQSRFDERTRGAADLLVRVSLGQTAEMGSLLERAVPKLKPAPINSSGHQLRGEVVSYRWPRGGPPPELLGPPGASVSTEASLEPPAATCLRCGSPLPSGGSRRGRPAKFCSGTCRTAAHRAARAGLP